MLRALLVVLLLANLGFWAWTQGWLAPVLPPRVDPREPERLAAQLKPERVTVLTPRAASAAVAAASASNDADAPVCLEAGPFADTAAATAAEKVLADNEVPDGSVQREPAWTSFTWGVVIPRLADRDLVKARMDELRKIGVRADELTQPPWLVPGLRLGNYSDKYGAESALASAVKKGVRGARVAELPAGPAQYWLRAARADAELQTRLKSLPAERLGEGFRPCKPRASAG